MPSIFIITIPTTSRNSDSYDNLDGIISNDAFASRLGALRSLRKLVLEELEESEIDGDVTLNGKSRLAIEGMSDEELEAFAEDLGPEPFGITELELVG